MGESVKDVGTTGGRPLLAIDRETLVPIGLLIAVVLAAVGGTWALSQSFNDLQAQMAKRDSEFSLRFVALENQITNLQTAADGANGQHWSRANMDAYVELMRTSNPTLKFPDVARIR